LKNRTVSASFNAAGIAFAAACIRRAALAAAEDGFGSKYVGITKFQIDEKVSFFSSNGLYGKLSE